MSLKACYHQSIESKSADREEAVPATLQSTDRTLPSRLGEKHNPMPRKNTEKSVLDDIMGDPDDFGDMGGSDVDSDAGRWEDTLRDMEQCDTRVEENLQLKLLNSQASFDVACNSNERESSEASLRPEVKVLPTVDQDYLKAESISFTSNVASHFTTRSKRFFIIKSLNYHNIEKSIQKGIWATQAMNERILNEAFESADKVILIFSVNMSGHFQGYAQMTSAIGHRKVNVWNEANWGGTFSVQWIQLYDLPFQKTLHLKNPLNSYKPVKISRDCQELTAEIGEALCLLLDEGAESEEYSKRRIHVRSDYFTKKPYMEGPPPLHSSAYFTASLRNQMHSVVFPAQLLSQMQGRSLYVKHAGSSSSRPTMHLRGACDLRQQEEMEAVGFNASQEEDFLNMSYEEYLQFQKTSGESKYQQQGISSSQWISPAGVRWGTKGDMDICADDAYATYLASWYAAQQTPMIQNEYYQTGPSIASSFRKSEQPP